MSLAEPKERIHFNSQVDAMDRSADQHRDFDAFVMSAKGETSTKSFQEWAGGDRVTLAIVFTDVVGSTALGEQIRDESMNEVRRAHFAQSRKLIGQFRGREIKTIGDSFMAAFKSAGEALDYSVAFQRNTGHPQIQIRAGIHIGPMHVEESDVFGGTVNFASRVVGAIIGAEIWLSDRAKEDIDRLGACRAAHTAGMAEARWHSHEGVSGHIHAVVGAKASGLRRSVGMHSCDRRLARVRQWINYGQEFVSAKIVLLSSILRAFA